jgi:DNA polymerase-1
MDYMEKDDESGTIKSADAQNLRAVDDELAEAVLEFRSEFKVMSTYVRPMIHRHYDTYMRMWKEPFVNPQGRIHANYRQIGARTGRMSCSDPNMQNQPRDDLRLRYNIVADPGMKLVTCDLSNIEMMLFAAYVGEGRLLTAIQNGEDVHELTAKMLLIRDRARAGGTVETARQLGKTYNFSRIYGGGLKTIRKQFRCSLDQARVYKKRFDDAYPEVRNLTTAIEYRLYDQGYISDKLISGRRFRVEPREAYKATNWLVQGTAAAVLKEAVTKLHADGIPVVGVVHDEVIAHCREDEAEDVRDQITKRLTENERLNEVVPLKADGAIVDHWSDAKPLKDAAGREYLFTPEWAGGEQRYLDRA